MAASAALYASVKIRSPHVPRCTPGLRATETSISTCGRGQSAWYVVSSNAAAAAAAAWRPTLCLHAGGARRPCSGAKRGGRHSARAHQLQAQDSLVRCHPAAVPVRPEGLRGSAAAAAGAARGPAGLARAACTGRAGCAGRPSSGASLQHTRKAGAACYCIAASCSLPSALGCYKHVVTDCATTACGALVIQRAACGALTVHCGTQR